MAVGTFKKKNEKSQKKVISFLMAIHLPPPPSLNGTAIKKIPFFAASLKYVLFLTFGDCPCLQVDPRGVAAGCHAIPGAQGSHQTLYSQPNFC